MFIDQHNNSVADVHTTPQHLSGLCLHNSTTFTWPMFAQQHNIYMANVYTVAQHLSGQCVHSSTTHWPVFTQHINI